MSQPCSWRTVLLLGLLVASIHAGLGTVPALAGTGGGVEQSECPRPAAEHRAGERGKQSARHAEHHRVDVEQVGALEDLTAAQVVRALVKTTAGEMELEKKAEHWEISKPLRARADDQKINDLLAQVTTAQIQQFVAEDRGDLRPYGLAEPRGSVTLFTIDDKTGQTLQIGGVPEKEKEQVYVRFTARNAVYTLPKKIEELLALKPADLRDKHLVRIDTSMAHLGFRCIVRPSTPENGRST